MSELYPLKFRPVYKDYLWGGDRLASRFNRDLPGGRAAESWEISAHPDGLSVVREGPLAGRGLDELVAVYGRDLLGSAAPEDGFPLLIKLIDARDVLSVQVHPDNRSAARSGGDPKTEMWYFFEGDREAGVYCGLAPGTGRENFLAAVREQRLADVLRRVPAAAGEAVWVPGGRVHAIGRGCLLLEIQQNSNTTYRVYDWDRVGHDGRPRELHLEQALEVIDFGDEDDPRCTSRPFTEHGTAGDRICRSPYFRLDRFRLDAEITLQTDGTTFHAWFLPDGEARVRTAGGTTRWHGGESLLIPASTGTYTIQPLEGGGQALRTTLPGAEGD
ncbi:type I phosphomannose isomerase catalytic subunit [Kiritimatiella glycovorans]|uniref:type I phosphomannose isomerase catalytic subunit n=1 Tax=Kiritimatiella glycovorans TaxID=1307763 RepID=UPI00069B53BC|nr:type I phosphomannose isomerase catalytic subunit [Kiritimatiella glycovorans]